MTQREKQVFYRPELDVLRLLAFFLVFLHHCLPAPLGGGTVSRLLRAVGEGTALGVSLFFLLSAYLITELLLREKRATGTVSLRSFYLRRVLRIWPLYFAMLAFATLVGHYKASQAVPAGGLLAYLLLSGNWWSSLHGFLPVIAGPLWSISVEEQFYLLWPMLVLSASRRVMIACAAIIWLFAQAYLFWFARYHLATADQVWLNSIVQFQYFALGILLACVIGSRVLQFSPAIRFLLALLGVALLIIPETGYDALGYTHLVPWKAVMAVYPAAGIGSVCLFCSFLGARLPQWTSRLVYLGKISYGLYVFHVMIIYAAVQLLEAAGIQHLRILFVFALALPVIILTAHLSYQYFEKPFLLIKERFAIIKTPVA